MTALLITVHRFLFFHCFSGKAAAFDLPRMYVRQLSGEFSGAIGKRPPGMAEGRITPGAVIEIAN